MNTLLATGLAALVLALPAHAASPLAAPERAQAEAADSARDPAPVATRKAASRDDNPLCVRETGTRIRAPKGERRCTGIGRTYSRDDLLATGAMDLADALRRLDPSIR